jgi:hypothetical protein
MTYTEAILFVHAVGMELISDKVHMSGFHGDSTMCRSSTKSRHMDHIIMKMTELHQNNMNKEDGFYLSQSWKPLISSLKNTGGLLIGFP